MKGIFKKTLSMVLCFVMVFTMFQGTMLSASAKVVGPDNKTELTITTDKSKYSWGDTIIFNITVKNVSNETLKGIKINSFAREVTQIAQQGDLPVIPELQPGESKTVQIEYYATKLASFLIIFMPIFWIFNPAGKIAYREANFNYEQRVKIGMFKHKIGFEVEYNQNSHENPENYASTPESSNVVTDRDTKVSYVNNEILLTAKEGTAFDTIEKIVQAKGGSIVGYIKAFDEYQIRFNQAYTKNELNTLAQELKNDSNIINSSLDYAMNISTEGYYKPNDPWGDKDGWNSEIPEGDNWGVEAINAPQAWDHRDEMSPITVGVIDSGFDTNHEDLQGVFSSTYYNPEFEEKTQTQNGTDYHKSNRYHGTHVAGTIVANMNNKKGFSGIMPSEKSNGDRLVTIVGATVNNGNTGTAANAFSKMYTFVMKTALAELIIRNTKVINISMAFNWYNDQWNNEGVWSNNNITDKAQNIACEYSKPLADFLKRALEKGYDYVISAAAGNDSNKGGSNNRVNAEFASPWNAITDETVKEHIIVVGSIGNNGRESKFLAKDTHKGYYVSDFSNTGSRVDVVAPGEDIYSCWADADSVSSPYSCTVKNKRYALMNGTSMATPHTSGVAAMVWAINPNLSGKQVKDIITGTADRPVNLNGTNYNILNAEAAVNKAIESKTNITPWHPDTSNYGALISRVTEAANESNFISDASVAAYSQSGDYKASATSDTNGQFEFFLPEGDYTLVVYKEGYMPGVMKDVNVTKGGVHYIDWFKLAQETEQSQAQVKGTINNSISNTAVPDVNMTFKNVYTQEDIASATTDSMGNYSITLPIGYYDVTLSKTGFITETYQVVASPEMSSISQNATISPEVAGNTYRIVLTWGQNPRDLDSHITGQTSSGSSFHVYFSNKDAWDGETNVANLDVDDTSSYGPETITLNPTTTDTYKYYVHHYSGSGSISTSGAQVKLYKGNTLIGTYNAPTDQGTGIYWTVFEITNGTVKNINKIAGSVQ